MIELPKQKVPASNKSPKTLLLYSQPKIGKSSSVALLEDCLIIDLEKGTDMVDALKVQANDLDELKEVITAIKAANAAKGGFVYKYIALDTATKLEEFAEELAVILYKKSAMGKPTKTNPTGWQGTALDLKALEYGAGYGFIRQAYKMIMNDIRELCDTFILIGHTKDKIVEKNDKEVTSVEVDLSGKLAGIVTQKVDAIGYMYRKKNELHISFKNDGNIISGNRCAHLAGTDIVIVEKDENSGELKSHWDRIFID